eukprot:753656-Hanusia_phi.AAC.11
MQSSEGASTGNKLEGRGREEEEGEGREDKEGRKAANLSHLPHKLVGASMSPRREFNPIQPRAPLLASPQVEPVLVEQEVGQIVELRDQLLDVRQRQVGGAVPRLPHRGEDAVSMIKLPALEVHVGAGEGLKPDEVEHDGSSGRVVGGVVEGRRRVLGVRLKPIVEPLLVLRCPRLVLRSHGLREVAEDFGPGEVELLGGVVSENPGEDGVLGEVIVVAARQRVEVHEQAATLRSRG